MDILDSDLNKMKGMRTVESMYWSTLRRNMKNHHDMRKWYDTTIALKNGKSPGIDSTPAELIKTRGTSIADDICKLMTLIWQTAHMPKEWTMGLISPHIRKRINWNKYKGITLLCTIYRTFTHIYYIEHEEASQKASLVTIGGGGGGDGGASSQEGLILMARNVTA